MPSDCINLKLNFHDHPKFFKLRNILNIGDAADLLPIYLWCYAGSYSYKDGKLSPCNDLMLESIIRWKGNAGQAAKAMEACGFIHRTKDAIVVHDWEEYQGHIWMLHIRNKNNIKARWDKWRAESGKNTNGYTTGTINTIQQTNRQTDKQTDDQGVARHGRTRSAGR